MSTESVLRADDRLAMLAALEPDRDECRECLVEVEWCDLVELALRCVLVLRWDRQLI